MHSFFLLLQYWVWSLSSPQSQKLFEITKWGFFFFEGSKVRMVYEDEILREVGSQGEMVVLVLEFIVKGGV